MSTKSFVNFVFVFGKHVLATDGISGYESRKDGSTLVNTECFLRYKIRTVEGTARYIPLMLK
jgi:hypothetical protein